MVEVEGMRAYVYFNVINIVDEGSSYPTLLWIKWDKDSLEVINFNKHVLNFENHDIRVIALMDPIEGKRYIEPVKDEALKGWDHAYNISKDYIQPTVDDKLGWRSSRFASSDSDDALENWKNLMHEVSIRKCGLITRSLCRVTIEIVELPTYEGLPELFEFLVEFEDKVLGPQRLLALDEALKDTPACWWETHKKSTNGWSQC